MEFTARAEGDAAGAAGEEDDGSKHRILGVGVGVFVLAFFLLLTIVCCVAASACRRGAWYAYSRENTQELPFSW
jgi:hypothetical protein